MSGRKTSAFENYSPTKVDPVLNRAFARELYVQSTVNTV